MSKVLRQKKSVRLEGDGFYDGAAHEVKIENSRVVDDPNIIGILDIRKEALRLSLLAKDLPIEYGPDRAAAHEEFEKYTTRLGFAMGREAERRANINEAFIKNLEQRILSMKTRYSYHIEPRILGIEKLSRAMGLEAAALIEQSHQEPLDPIEYKKYSQLVKKSHVITWKYKAVKVQEELMERRQSLAYLMLDFEKNKLCKAYKSVIADIREVGGSFPMTKYSDAEIKKLMDSTVGKDYPSSWMKTSEQHGPMVIQYPKEEGAESSYTPDEVFLSGDSPLAATEGETNIGEPELIEKLYWANKHSDPRVVLDTVPFECEGELHQILQTYEREFFNPEIHGANEDGTPTGTGWMLNNPPIDDEFMETVEATIGPYNQWYRTLLVKGETLDTIAISNGMKNSHAYHEFCHRIEHVIPAVVFQEQAFLSRRALNEDGTTKSTYMVDDRGQKMDPFFRIGSAMSQGNKASQGETTDKATDEICQYMLMQDGDFVVDYIGRIYTSTGGREVFSVGAEMLFAGSYGAFKGYDPDFPVEDLDHRGFVLGLFAIM